MKRRIVVFGLMAVLFSAMCIVENAAVKSRPAQPRDRVSSVYMLAGEFRAVFANLLWVKAEKYHHEFLQRDSDWTRDKELLGLIDLIIRLDPTFIEAYATGAYIYADGCNDKSKAVKYLLRGISNNPESAELYRLVAIAYSRRFNDPERALPFARKALVYAEDDWYRDLNTRLVKTLERDLRERRAATGGRPSRISR